MSIFEDVRFGLRTLAKSPGFTAIAITALALGIGVNATVFSLVNGILYKNLPFAGSDRIYYIVATDTASKWHNHNLSYPEYLDLRASIKSFDAVGASTGEGGNISDQTAAAESYHGARITVNSFSLIGQKPVVGRDFLPADAAAGAAPVAILSYKVWQERYGKDLSVIGRVVRLNEIPTTIIGVMPARLDFPRENEVWMPLIFKPDYEKRENRSFNVYGHIAPHATLKSADAEAVAIFERLATEYPVTNKTVSAHAVDFNEVFASNESGIKTIFLAMLGAVGFVLLIACANVANMQLARAVSRMREISIRVALGAGRWRIIRQLLVESVMVSIAGGLIGWVIALWGTRAFDNAVTPTGKPAFLDFSMDVRALLYLAAITIGTGLLFGLAPAFRLSKLNVNTALKDGSRSSTTGRGKYLSGLLVVVEMALAVVLLAGAGLMIRSFMNAYRSSLGANTTNVLLMSLNLPDLKYPRTDQKIAFFDQLKSRIDATAGVEVSCVTTSVPLDGTWDFPYEIEGQPKSDPRQRPSVNAVNIGSDYFRVMGNPLLVGRDFTPADRDSTIIVNRQLARAFWHEDDVIGKRLRIYEKDVAGPWMTVIGIAPDITYTRESRAKNDPVVYLPYPMKHPTGVWIAARTNVPPASLKQIFRREVQAIDQDLPVFSQRTMEEQLEHDNWPYRVFGTLFAIFAAIALILASVGLYAVIAHSVSQRTQEIGVRMALGATGVNILQLIFSQGMTQLAIGLTIGLAAALAVTKVLKALLVDVSPSDPATFVMVAIVLSIAAALGTLIPARRAMRVDPIEALRHE